ncbi:TMEM175 family protein [Pengzhenrongella sp.]|jgi:uncharacterized membrane protein|uniref:TMEM175 family protein n=1 Tax=Pengzhenrongella sp. TaxID=2888820 RepID=UPI002F958036
MSEAEQVEIGSGTQRDVTRLVNLSDAVVSIAATLLVLPLATDASQGSVSTLAALADQSGRHLLLFLLSFAVICRFWLVHHALFDTIVAFNVPLFWINALWLVSIVVLPYTTGLIGAAQGNNQVATGVYISTMLITTLAGLAMQWLINRSPELHAPGMQRRLDLAPAVVIVVTMLLALVTAIVVPATGPWALCLLIPSGQISRLATHLVRRGRPAGN